MSYCFLLDFIYSMQPNMVNKIKEPVFNNNSDRMLLGNHSAKQLNIIETTNNNKLSSVIKFLNNLGGNKFKYEVAIDL